MGLSTRSPDRRLHPYVESLCHSWDEWPGAEARGTRPVRVVPDGSIELLFSFEAATPGRDAALRRGGEVGADCFGARTGPLWVHDARPVCNVSARLRPGAGRRFFGVPARELTDGKAPLAALWGDAAPALAEAMARAPGPEERTALLERALLERVDAASDREAEGRVAGALAGLRASGGRAPIRRVCESLGVGERRLERLFAAHVGVTPKTFARIVRFERARAALAAGGEHAATALACGYADQAHMVRDFRRLAGATPTRLHPPAPSRRSG